MGIKRSLIVFAVGLGVTVLLVGQSLKDEIFETQTLSQLSASGNKKGDRFTLQVIKPESYAGAMIEGEVTKAKAAGKVSGRSELVFRFDKMVLKDGTVVDISADLQNVRNSQGVDDVDEEGQVIGKSSKKKDIATAATAAGIGALIGGIAGGKGGAAKGAAIGAAVGFTINFTTRGPDIKFAPGSVFILSVSEAKTT